MSGRSDNPNKPESPGKPDHAADPGRGAANREQRLNARKQAWARPTRKQDRDALRAERVAAAREGMFDEALAKVRGMLRESEVQK